MRRSIRRRIPTCRGGVALAAATLALLAVAGAPALAAEGPGWYLTSRSYPTYITPGGTAEIDLQIFNVGAADSNGAVTVTITLPAGIEATEAGDLEGYRFLANPQVGHSLWECTGTSLITCTNNLANLPAIAGGAGGSGGAGPNFVPQILVKVRALPGAAEHETARATIVGGGAPTAASTVEPITISAAPPPFGLTGWDVWFSNADGTLDTQAGSHPYAATFSFDLNNVTRTDGSEGWKTPEGKLRNIEVKLPPGFVGNPTAVAQCTRQELDNEACPFSSQVGFDDATILSASQNRQPVFNMVPPAGVAAEFAFTLNGVNVFLDSIVRGGSDYGITTNADDTPQRGVLANVLTLWGVPGERGHDRWRNASSGGCSEAEEGTSECPRPGDSLKPFLTLPTACAGPAAFTIRVDTWENDVFGEPAVVDSHDSNGTATGFTGCEHLSFDPSIVTSPDTVEADTPTGLTVEVKPPVGGLEDPGGNSTADIQNTTVALPEGLVINPGQAAGLQACQSGQDGLTTEAEKAAGQEDNNPPTCPGASKIGTVSIKTPLLEDSAERELAGNVYVLQSNPPELKLLIAASADGVNLKLVGTVHLNEQTGKLTTTFEGTPELPFTDFKLSFSGGAQAALDTPAYCGTYESTSDFTPWSSPFDADAFPTSTFTLSQGPGGGACPSSQLPFTPTLVAGSTTDKAGGSTGFSMLLSRADGQQRIERLQFKIPAGLSGIISSVPLCGEPQAALGTCPASSHVGHTAVTSGPGPYPLVIPQPGDPEAAIFLTGPYKGAPFGLSIVTPVIAGPFNLGTIVTRAAIEVDPRTAQITVTTDPLPQVVDGVPTDIRSVDAVIDRPGFMINPTNCEPGSFSGTAWGTPPPGAGGTGASAAISSHFQVGSCRSLTFTPKLSVSTTGHASKKTGTSLSFKIAYPQGALGSESWFNEAKFDIPKQLPARLSTIQQACIAATFETNRAACPKHSVIGHAIVHTPVLPTPLEGPVYFVSYGGAKFPDAVLVLSGDNVNIELHGNTFINGTTGVTSATFKALPDVPFESIEVSLPSGEYSEFGANLPAKDHFDFCGQKLTMPTYFKAQNGLEIKQSTTLNINNCPKAKKAKKASKHASKKAKRSK